MSHKIVDFEVNRDYVGVDNNVYTVIFVDDNYIICRFNNVKIRMTKFLYAGVYAACRLGNVILKSTKVIPVEDSSIEFELLGPRKRRNVDIKINNINETYLKIFKQNKG